MTTEIHIVAMKHQIPAGAMGPEPVTIDVRAYLVPSATGLVLIDTGMHPSGRELDEALRELGAAWADVSSILITHGHRDHVGALDHVRSAAPAAKVMASPLDGLPDVLSLADGDVVGPLRVVATPGHTPGHLCFLAAEQGALFVGDCLGALGGKLHRGPERFTADPELAEQSLHNLLAFRGTRMLFGHGDEISDPWSQLEAMLR